jgi:hypothetical protein
MSDNFELTNHHFSDYFNPEFPDIDFNSSENVKENSAIYKNNKDRYLLGRNNLRKCEEAFNTLIDNTNSNSLLIGIALARVLVRSHRTKQQIFVKQLLYGLLAYIKWAKERGAFDARNKAVVDMTDDLEKVLSKNPMPYI